jgi:hypothetical protein
VTEDEPFPWAIAGTCGLVVILVGVATTMYLVRRKKKRIAADEGE